MIRRTFTPRHAPYSKRVFCGFCGTHLSYWSEQPPEEAEFLNVTVGSLRDVQALQELDLLPEDINTESLSTDNSATDGTQEVATPASEMNAPLSRETTEGRSGNVNWFEEMIHGSRLGRAQKTRRGVGVSADGSTTVEWEVSEWTEGDSTANTPSKRKIEQVSGEDVSMKG
jgi:hypothetical protein